MNRGRQLLLVAASAGVLAAAACGGGSGAPATVPTATPTPTIAPMLVAQPASVGFTIFSGSPTATVDLLAFGGVGQTLTASVADPTRAGASTPVWVAPGKAQTTITALAGGTTTVTISDGLGASAAITYASDLCGRPENLAPQSTLLFPPKNSTGNPTTGVTAFVGLASVGKPGPMRMHLIVGPHETLEAPAPQPAASAPPGSDPAPVPTPTATTVGIYAAPLPALPAGRTIRVQISDDWCEPPFVVGSFST
ncbi:MAG TPA: hypothetical protein VGN14_00990 [Candidatus Elarobacter sp.]|jgi:hypothetical protein